MRRSLLGLGALALMLVSLSAPARANDQEWVLGFGLGPHSFSETDDFRKGSGAFEDNADEISGGIMFQLYGEWYLFDDIGLGLRLMSVTGGRTYTYLDAEQTDTVTIGAQLITVNWVPLGSEDYVRMGVLGGIGAASYEAKTEVTFNSGSSGENTSQSETSNGTAALIGVYVDWGGEDFGARFGLNVLNTDLDPIEANGREYEVDGSGAALYFDLRWAWE